MAKKTWMEAMRLDPDNTSCRLAIKRMNRQEDAKEKGNQAFKAGNQEEAIKFYTEGIEQDPFNKTLTCTLYANRAAANLKLKNHKEALADCDKALELNDGYAKVLINERENKEVLGLFEKRRD